MKSIDQKRKEAHARALASGRRTIKEQIRLLATRPGQSELEMLRLQTALIHKKHD